MLTGRVVRIRPGGTGDAARLRAILAEESVSRWWGEPDPLAVLEADMRGSDDTVLLVMEIGGQVAGGIQYVEEDTPMYRHAGIDIFLGGRFQRQYERGGDGQFHDGLLMDLLRDELIMDE